MTISSCSSSNRIMLFSCRCVDHSCFSTVSTTTPLDPTVTRSGTSRRTGPLSSRTSSVVRVRRRRTTMRRTTMLSILQALLFIVLLHTSNTKIQYSRMVEGFGHDRILQTTTALRISRTATTRSLPLLLLLPRRRDRTNLVCLYDSKSDNINNEKENPPSTPTPKSKPKLNQPKSALGSKQQTTPTTNLKRKKTVPKKQPQSQPSKQDLVRAVGEQMKQQQAAARRKETERESSNRLLDRINPFKAGQSLRQTILDNNAAWRRPPRQSVYYMEDTMMSNNNNNNNNEDDDYIPEVLVVGATGSVGRMVVQQLLLTTQPSRVRVRVLVRDLYTTTLNKLGTGVTYCQGDLSNVDSLEYAVTDVDKIVFCAAPPRPEEDEFQTKLREALHEQYAQPSDNIINNNSSSQGTTRRNEPVPPPTRDNVEWERMSAAQKLRTEWAEQVDCVGMQNLVRAYQNVRHADYGTSQAAKRTVFKFAEGRPEDFDLFALDDDDNDDEYYVSGISSSSSSSSSGGGSTTIPKSNGGARTAVASAYNDVDDDDDEEEEEYGEYSADDDYEDIYGDFGEDDTYGADTTLTTAIPIEQRREVAVKTQSRWLRNQHGHGVFVGRIPKLALSSSTNAVPSVAGESAIVSSRLRSREDPDQGIELGPGFSGFICRVCSDGGTYEAFVRTGAYYEDGIEYVCEFSTYTKGTSRSSKSRNKFVTIRLPFENFKPVQRKKRNTGKGTDGDAPSGPVVAPFRGRDVRNIGFRYRSVRNEGKVQADKKGALWNRFYMSLSYIKLYRSQPEPEFVYISDARIPPVVRDGMVSHAARQLLPSVAADSTSGNSSSDEQLLLLDDSSFATVSSISNGRISPEEVYYKYRGEEILKASGLAYAIVRIAGWNELSSGDASAIALTAQAPPTIAGRGADDDNDANTVSRAAVARVCVRALLDPHALNKSFYVAPSKSVSTRPDEDLSAKFAALPKDPIA